MNLAERLKNIKNENTRYTDGQVRNLLDENCVSAGEMYVRKSKMADTLQKERSVLRKMISDAGRKMESDGLKVTLDEEGKVRIGIPGLRGVSHSLNDRQTAAFWQTVENPLLPECGIDSYKELVSVNELYRIIYQLQDIDEKMEIEENKIKKGDAGEQYVSDQMSMYEGKYHIRKNVLIPANDVGGETSETDVYLVTSKAVFVCEVKNWGKAGQTIWIGSDGQWTLRTGNSYDVLKSPVQQNTRHCLATERFFKANGIKDYKIVPMVIIANNDVMIHNESSSIVIRISELYNCIEGMNLSEKIPDAQQSKILALFDSCRVEERAFRIPAISPKKREIENYISRIMDLYRDELRWRNAVMGEIDAAAVKSGRLRVGVRVALALSGLSAAVCLVIVFLPVIKFLVALGLLGLVCGGLASKK